MVLWLTANFIYAKVRLMLKVCYLVEPSLQDFQEWQELWSNSPDATLFNSPAWFKVCCQAFPQREQLIVMAKAEDCLGAILLLEKQRNQWTLMGRPYMDRASLLFLPSFIDQYGHQLLSILLKKFKILELSELGHNQLNILLKSSKKFLNSFSEVSLNPRFVINKPSLNSKEKREIRRLTRRFSERGNWSIEFQAINDRSFELMCFIEKLSHKISRKQAILEKEEVKKLLIGIGSMSNSYVAFLIHNGKPVAHLLGLIEKDSFLAYHMAYDENWADCAPGKLLIYHILPKLEKDGLLYFDFSRGQSQIKHKFSNIINTQYCFKLFTKSYIGYFNYFVWKLEQLLDLMRLKIAGYLPSSWKNQFRSYFNFWLDRRK